MKSPGFTSCKSWRDLSLQIRSDDVTYLESSQEPIQLLDIVQASLRLAIQQELSRHARQCDAAILVQAGACHLAPGHLLLEVLVTKLCASLDVEGAIPCKISTESGPHP